MPKLLINKSLLTSLCDAVRAASGETGLINIGENGAGLCEKIGTIPEPMGVYAWKRYKVTQGASVSYYPGEAGIRTYPPESVKVEVNGDGTFSITPIGPHDSSVVTGHYMAVDKGYTGTYMFPGYLRGSSLLNAYEIATTFEDFVVSDDENSYPLADGYAYEMLRDEVKPGMVDANGNYTS